MSIEVWQATIGVVITAAVTLLVARGNAKATREQSTATTGAEIIGQLRQQIDEQHQRFAEDLAANRAEHDRQMTAIRTEHEKQKAELEEIVSRARAERRVDQDYIGILRKHINDGEGAPPPPWPKGVTQ